MSGSFGTNLSQYLNLSTGTKPSSSLTDGKLVSVTAGSTSGGEQPSVTLTTPSGSRSLNVSQSLPEGSVMLGRIESTGEGMKLRLLQARDELKQVKTEELMKLLRKSSIDLSGRDAQSLKQQLVDQGHLPTATESGSSQSSRTIPAQTAHPLKGANLPVKSAPENLNLPSGENQTFNITVLSSEGSEARVQYQGQSFTVETPEPLNSGTRLEVSSRKSGDRTVLQVQSGQQRTFDQQQLNEMLKTLNLSTSDENRTRLTRTILNNTHQSPEKLLERIKSEFKLNTVPDRSGTMKALEGLMKDFRTSNSGTVSQKGPTDLSNLSKQELSGLLKQFGIEPDQSARDALKTVLRTDPNPSKSVAKTVMDNIGVVRDQSGQINPDKLKALLFLTKNDLPVKQEFVDLLQFTAPDTEGNVDRDISGLKQALQSAKSDISGMENPGKTEKNIANLSVPEFNPGSSSQGSDELIRVLKTLGFDLERQVVNQPEQASDSLRSQLTQLQQTLSEAATEKIQQFAQSGGTDLKNESQRVLSQLFKFSMGSVAEDDSIFLFVPFPDGDQTGLMKIHFRDESETDEIDDEQWSVTINLELSKLGALQVQAQRRENQLNLNVRAESESALEIIRSRADELTEPLTERGFDVYFHTAVLREDEEAMIDWNLYFDTDQYTGTLDVTI